MAETEEHEMSLIAQKYTEQIERLSGLLQVAERRGSSRKPLYLVFGLPGVDKRGVVEETAKSMQASLVWHSQKTHAAEDKTHAAEDKTQRTETGKMQQIEGTIQNIQISTTEKTRENIPKTQKKILAVDLDTTAPPEQIDVCFFAVVVTKTVTLKTVLLKHRLSMLKIDKFSDTVYVPLPTCEGRMAAISVMLKKVFSGNLRGEFPSKIVERVVELSRFFSYNDIKRTIDRIALAAKEQRKLPILREILRQFQVSVALYSEESTLNTCGEEEVLEKYDIIDKLLEDEKNINLWIEKGLLTKKDKHIKPGENIALLLENRSIVIVGNRTYALFYVKFLATILRCLAIRKGTEEYVLTNLEYERQKRICTRAIIVEDISYYREQTDFTPYFMCLGGPLSINVLSAASYYSAESLQKHKLMRDIHQMLSIEAIHKLVLTHMFRTETIEKYVRVLAMQFETESGQKKQTIGEKRNKII